VVAAKDGGPILDDLKSRTQGWPNIRILTDMLSDDDADRLLCSADAFVSLHRAEGFGLSIAQAMAMGRPVIVTGWSGNMDFCGEGAVLAASLTAAIAAMAAVAWFLASKSGRMGPAEVTLALVAIALSWVFVHLLFAVRYAHEYWQAGGGLEFPGGGVPEFSDFLYFGFTIGMTFQTSDVAVSSSLMRQLTLVHALVSFLFNVVILAAAVNVAAGLVG
jgi:hypothetical protein